LNPTGRFLLGVVVGLLILPASLYLYVATGHAPVATADAAMPMEAFFAKIGRKSRIKAEQPKRDLATFSTGDLAIGADIYQKDCAFCHGLPNQPKPAAAKGMFPHVPQLLDRIRLSGMPGFKESLSETQMWQVSALLAKADQLPPEVTAKFQPTGVNINTPVNQ
jgi:thiosulfate dehydrogenase